MNRVMFRFTVLLIMAFLAAGCSGNGREEGEVKTADSAKVEKMTPADLGKAVADNYVEVMNKVIELLKDKPPVEEVKPKVETLKETYIQKFVALGERRESFTQAERASADSRISMGVMQIPGATYTQYSDIQRYYMQENLEMGNLIASFNIITQYASFELLKKQEPQEAERLGIE